MLDVWPAIDVSPDLAVLTVRALPSLPPPLEAEVARIWEQARRERPRLFNGTVFSADRISRTRIEGHWTEYRRVLAQMRAPHLFKALQIRSLAVNGLLECAQGIVLGRRDRGSVYQAGMWQSPPAGSVEQRPGATNNRVDLASQVLAECQEELGIPPEAIATPRAIAAIGHPGTRIVDIGMMLSSQWDFGRIEDRWRAGRCHEYEALRLLTRAEAEDLLAARKFPLLPTTRLLIERWLLL